MSGSQSVTFFEISAMIRLGQRTELEAFLRQFSSDLALCEESELEIGKARAIFVISALVHSMLELGADESVERNVAQQAEIFLGCSTPAGLSEAVAVATGRMLACTSPHSNRFAEQLVSHAVEMISNEYAQPITDEIIAARVHLSRSHFRYLFKAVTGKPFNRYVTEFRLVEARKLLEGSSHSVKEVSRLVGFSEVTGFCRAYRVFHGVAPSKHRKAVSHAPALRGSG